MEAIKRLGKTNCNKLINITVFQIRFRNSLLRKPHLRTKFEYQVPGIKLATLIAHCTSHNIIHLMSIIQCRIGKLGQVFLQAEALFHLSSYAFCLWCAVCTSRRTKDCPAANVCQFVYNYPGCTTWKRTSFTSRTMRISYTVI